MGKNAKNNVNINNPFRNKFGNQKPNFKNKFSNKKQFNSNEQRQHLSKEWGKEKFVPKVPRHAHQNETPNGEPATPWGHFKTELLDKQREEAHANAVDMNSSEAQEVIKKRDQNYRRTLITSQAKQPTKWEKFDDDEDVNAQTGQKDKTKTNFNKKTTKKGATDGRDKLFSGIVLKDFDSKKLTSQQNNNMRKVLTKGIMSLTDKSLESAVRDMKHKQKKKVSKHAVNEEENAKNKMKLKSDLKRKKQSK